MPTATNPATGFLAKTRLKKSGGSLVVTVPASARNLLDLAEGQELSVSVENGRVVMEPVIGTTPMRVRKPRHTIEELVDGYEPPVSESDRVWIDAPPVGREVW